MIVALEGIDAAGKGLQSRTLCNYLAKRSEFTEVDTLDFPHSDTVAGAVVGRVLRGETSILTEDQRRTLNVRTSVDLTKMWSRDKAIIVQALMLADRAEWQHKLADYEHDPKKLIILDRYYYSSIAYGTADGLEASWLYRIHSMLIEPDLHVLLDVPVHESFRRRADRRDAYEKDEKKLHQVRHAYLAAFADEDGCAIVDGTRSPAEVGEEILEHILSTQTDLLGGAEVGTQGN